MAPFVNAVAFPDIVVAERMLTRLVSLVDLCEKQKLAIHRRITTENQIGRPPYYNCDAMHLSISGGCDYQLVELRSYKEV